MAKRYSICGMCKHIPLYCRCGPASPTGRASWRKPEPNVNFDGVAVVAADLATNAKGRLLAIADMLDQDGLYFFSGEIRGNLEAALETAREEGYEVGYDAAKESVGEWLERLEP